MPPCLALAWLDHVVIAVYVVVVIVLGAVLSRRQNTDDDYFLGGRRMPWFAVGVSIIATLLSSLTYLSEPGEVWKSGLTHLAGKMLAIPFEMLLVWLIFIPFLMRFRYTSAYEYLGDRFGIPARRLGVVLFLALVISWMGFVVLATSRALAVVTEMNLYVIIATVGLVATLYTVLGGMRAVVWTDVLQVALLLGGAFLAMGWVMFDTGSTPRQWIALVVEHASGGLPVFSVDPTVRATILTVALHMFVWHICTHVANQMTVQRYFSTVDLKAARRSFVTGSLLGVLLNCTLCLVGAAIFYYYFPDSRPEGLDPNSSQADMIFPEFVVHRLPPGIAGGILAALFAAAMSTVDSGINSVATVLAVEWRTAAHEQTNHVRRAQLLTLVIGLFITAAAFGVDQLTGTRNIVEMMPRSFNCFIGSLGGMFLVGMFLPRASGRTVVVATLAGLAAAVLLAYSKELLQLEKPVSFTWVMPGSLLTTLVVAAILSRFDPAPLPQPGLTWKSRHVTPDT